MNRRYRLAIIAAVSVLVVTSLVCAAEEVSVDVPMARGDGCFISPDGVGLWSSLWDEDTIFAEAEDARGLSFQEGQGPIDDADCAGGTCLAHVANAEFPLQIVEAGTYRGWARALLPWPGSWTHNESMDGGAKQQVRDSDARIFGEWYWTPLGEYRLGAGAHTFVLHNWLGGAKIDCVVFSADPDFDPTRLSGIPAGPGATSGVATSRPVLPSAVAEWRRLEWQADPGGGALAAEASADGGETWRPADGGDLSALEAAGDGTDTLIVRFTLTAEDGGTPMLRGVSADFTIPDDAEVALGNEQYRVLVARKTGRLAGIENRAVGVACTPLHVQQSIVGLAVREPGAHEQTVVAPDEFAFEGLREAEDGVAIDYSALDGQIRVRVEMAADDTPLCDWDIEVANRSELEVIRIDFPLVGNAAIGDFRDDQFVLPHTGGRIIDRPATDRTWTSTYMGGGSMSFIDLCDEEAGLMVHMMDRTLRDTEMEAAPSAGNEAVDLAMRTHTFVMPSETKRRSYRIGVHSGDWHRAADRYREWALSWMERPENPEWLRTCDGWVGASSVPFDSMTGRLAQARSLGIGYLQYWGQMADGIDQCCGNFYWPAPALGGAEGFREGIAEVQARGGHVTAYMNCQTWTRDAPVNEALRQTPKSTLPQEALDLIHGLDWFERWRCYPLNGEPIGYYASTLGWYIMCPGSTGWHEHLRFWIADMYAERFGADGVYIDQTGATSAKPCYRLDHGHDDTGQWGSGNVEMLRTSLEAAREVNPEFIIAIEGAGDALGQYANLHLISGLCTHPEVYHYTFPDHILISGLSNSSHLTLPQRISRAFLNGDRFDARVGPNGLTSALKLRRRIKPWLYPARFMDDIGLEVSGEDVLARWNICAEDGERALVLNFDNEQKVEGAVCSLELPAGYEQPRRLFVFDLEGGVRAEEPQVTDGVLQVEVPASSISTALALYETQPAHAVDVWQVEEEAGGVSKGLTLNAVNLGTEAITASVTVEAEAPLSVEGGPQEVALPPGGTATLAIPVVGLNLLELPTPVTVRTTWPGGERESVAELRPLLLNPSLTINEDGDDTPDQWVASGTRSAAFERGVTDEGAWIHGQEGETLFIRQAVPASHETAYYFAAEIRREEGAGDVSAAVVEHLDGGGLRVHSIGAEGEIGEWQRFETTFTTGDDFDRVLVYLYNNQSTGRAWFRNIELHETQP